MIAPLPRRQAIQYAATQGAFVLAILAFRASLDVAYVGFVSQSFTYQGFKLSIDHSKVIESYFLTVLLATLCPAHIRRPSDFLLGLLLTMPIVPSLSYYALADGNRLYAYSIAIAFIVIWSIKILPTIGVMRIRRGRVIAIILSTVSVVAVLQWNAIHGGSARFNLDLTKVYDFREAAADANQGIFAYLTVWVSKVSLPFLIVWTMWRRNYKFLVLLLICNVFLFGFTSQKSVLFYPALILGVFCVIRRWSYMIIMPFGFSIMLLALLYTAWNSGNLMLPSLFIRRLFFVPALLNFAYYEVFTAHGFVYLSNSIFSSIIAFPFADPAIDMVASYLNQDGGSPNDGFLGTAYMHFGYFGMLLFSLIIGGLFWVTDSLAEGKIPVEVSAGIAAVPFFAVFTSADLLTALATHGLGFCLMLLWLIGAEPGRRASSAHVPPPRLPGTQVFDASREVA